MFDQGIPSDVRVLGGTAQVTVPAMIVDWLRRAAYAEIGSAAEALNEAAFDTEREAHPEWFQAPMTNLKEVYALLDAIGWSRTVPPVAVAIDLREDCWALMRALGGALEFADEDVSEAARHGAEHDEQAPSPVRGGEDERVGVLWDFIVEARACIDEMAVREGEGYVLDIAA
jgi:hypothetical protein